MIAILKQKANRIIVKLSFRWTKNMKVSQEWNWRKCCVFICVWLQQQHMSETDWICRNFHCKLIVCCTQTLNGRTVKLNFQNCIGSEPEPFCSVDDIDRKDMAKQKHATTSRTQKKKRTRNSINSCEHLLKIHWFNLTKNEKNSKQ